MRLSETRTGGEIREICFFVPCLFTSVDVGCPHLANCTFAPLLNSVLLLLLLSNYVRTQLISSSGPGKNEHLKYLSWSLPFFRVWGPSSRSRVAPLCTCRRRRRRCWKLCNSGSREARTPRDQMGCEGGDSAKGEEGVALAAIEEGITIYQHRLNASIALRTRQESSFVL